MKIDEAIEHLKNLKESGYESYFVKVRNSAGNLIYLTGFSIDTENKTVSLY